MLSENPEISDALTADTEDFTFHCLKVKRPVGQRAPKNKQQKSKTLFFSEKLSEKNFFPEIKTVLQRPLFGDNLSPGARRKNFFFARFIQTATCVFDERFIIEFRLEGLFFVHEERSGKNDADV